MSKYKEDNNTTTHQHDNTTTRNTMKERDYILGTDKAELDRLGLQHRIWRSHVLEGWQKAGITEGSRVLDVGAGPGYATVDLAEIVGAQGSVVAVERSANYLNYLKAQHELRGLKVNAYEVDLMKDDIPEDGFDVAWCRWVSCFVDSPDVLVKKIGDALHENGTVIFHEYSCYKSWRLFPRSQWQESFTDEVMKSWRETGGEPDIALELPDLLAKNGFVVTATRPLVFAIRPTDYMWQWPASFIEINLNRLLELGRVDAEWCDKVRTDLQAADNNPNAMMTTPMVLEIIAQKV